MASETTTKFKVDISELKKGIQDANRQIRLANAEFKAAAAGMDDWAKSADGIQKKIESLKTVLSNQERILSSYEKQLDLIVEQYGENSKEADEMRIKIAQQTATVNTTKKSIEGYTKQLDEMGNEQDDTKKSTDQMDKSVKDSGDTAKKASGGFSVLKGALADLVASGIKAAVKGLKELAATAKESFKEFDKGRDTLIAATGATGQAADELEKVYANVSKSIVGDMGDIGAAVGEVSTRFGLTGDDLEDLSEQFLKFAKLNKTDVASSVDDVQKALSAFGLKADKASGLLDALNKVAQDTGIDVSTLTKGLIQNSTAFQELGLSISDSAALMGQIEKSGANADAVMSGLRKALKTATKEGIPLKQALADLETEITKQTDSATGLQAAYDIFGKSGDQIFNALNNGTLSFQAITLAADEYAESVGRTYEETLDAGDKIGLAFQSMKVSLGQTVDSILTKYEPEIENAIAQITPVVQEVVKYVAEKMPPAIEKVKEIVQLVFPYVKSVFDWIMNNGSTVVATLGSIAAAMAVMGIANEIMKITGLFKTFFNVIQAGNGVMKAFNAIGMANPIGLIVAAVAGLIAAFVILWNKSEKFRNFWISLWENIKAAAAAVVDWFTAAFTAVGEFFSDVWENIKAIFNAAIAVITDYFRPMIEFYKAAFGIIADVATGCWEIIKKVWSVVGSWFKQNIIQPVSGFFSSMWDGLKNGARAAWDGITSVFGHVVDWFREKFSKAWEAVKAVFSIGGKVFDGIKDGIVSAFKTVVNAIIRGINKVVAVPFNAINGILDKLQNVSIAGFEPFKNLIHRLPVPEIPQLAQGGVLRRGQLGLLEGSGAEAVVPLENNKRWIAATAAEMRRALAADGVIGAVGAGKAGGGVTFIQNNNSPKALSRLEIYRQSKNLLAMGRAT